MPITGFVSHGLGIAVPSTLDSSTVAWVAAVVANGGTVSLNRQNIVNNLIVGLKTDGVWLKLDRLWILAAENNFSALTDMVALSLATEVNPQGTLVFTVDKGYFEANSDDYVNANVNLSTYGGQFVTNSGHVSAWSNTNVAGLGVLLGISSTSNTANQTTIVPQYSDNTAIFRCNDGIPSTGVTVADALGHYVANRSDVSATQGYKNGSNIINPNAAAGSIPNVNLAILDFNDTVVGPTFGSIQQCSQVSVGANLSATDVTNFYNRLRTYMTAVGVP